MQQRNENNAAAAVLWASAFVITALLIFQAGRLPANEAYAEMASTSNDYTLVTTNSGLGDDADPNELLYVIDNRGESLLVYEVEDARKQQIHLRDGGSLQNLFTNARR